MVGCNGGKIMKIVELEFTKKGAQIVTFTRDKYNRLVRDTHPFKHYIYEEDPDGEHTTLTGIKVSRKYFKKFWEAKTYIKQCEKDTFEGDLTYTKRYILDHGSELVSPGKPRTMFYDIETTGFSSSDDEIISIVAYDDYNDAYYDFIWAPEFEECNSERMIS